MNSQVSNSVRRVFKVDCYETCENHSPHMKCRACSRGLFAYCTRKRLKWSDGFENRTPTAGLNKFLDATLKTGLAAPAWYVGLIGASISDGAMTAADATLTSAAALFSAVDVGRAIIVKGAGASGFDLVTTIASFTSSSSVELTDTASTTVTGAYAAWDLRAVDTMSSHAPWVDTAPYSNATRPAWTPGTISAGSVDNSGSVAVFTINANGRLFGAFMVDNSTVSGTTGTLLGGGIFTSQAQQVSSGNTINVTITNTLTSS